MSHSFQSGQCVFHFNGDYSGYVTIVNLDDLDEIKIPCQCVLEFVGNYIRNRRISILEDVEYDILLQ